MKNNSRQQTQSVHCSRCARLAGWACLLLLAWIAGCERPAASESTRAPEAEPPAETEEELHFSLPGDYAQTVARLSDCRDAIRNAIAAGDFERAHHPLDEIDWLLNRLPQLARASGIPRREWETVVVSGEDLGESLGEIHADIDAGRTPDFAVRAKAIDDALTRLQAVDERANRQNKQVREK